MSKPESESVGLRRLRDRGLLIRTERRAGRTIVTLKCSNCGREFERDLHGSGLSSAIRDAVYCGRACSRATAGKNLQALNFSQANRFRYYKERNV